MKKITCYHFRGEQLRDGSPVLPLGEWLVHKGPVEPCVSGLHGSEHPFDALQYAPGPYLDLVELRGNLKSHGDPVDKWVGKERKRIRSFNAEKLLWDFARWNALKVLHLWNNPPDVVVKFLKTGDESLRAAALEAARDVAWDAAWDAAWAAAWDAAWAAARAAARAAAWDAARDASIKKSRAEFKRLVDGEFAKL